MKQYFIEVMDRLTIEGLIAMLIILIILLIIVSVKESKIAKSQRAKQKQILDRAKANLNREVM